MKPLPDKFARSIEQMDGLDPISSLGQKLIGRMVPQESKLKDLLSGTWLGHPIHPVLTDVVIGAWLGAFLVDVFAGETTEEAADPLILIGNLAALPTAAAGLSDYAELWGPQRRVAVVHAVGNTTALSLQAASYLARRKGKRARGKLLSVAAMGSALVSAYLGGHLSFAKGVGVSQTAFEDWPQDWAPVIALEDLPEERLTGAKANDVHLMLYRRGENVYALSDRCTHRGCFLHEGQVNDSTVTCPCHGSTFRLQDGGLVKGPAAVHAPSYEVRVREGTVEVRRPVT